MQDLIRRYGTGLSGLIVLLVAFWLVMLVIVPNITLFEQSFRPYLPVSEVGGPKDTYSVANYLKVFDGNTDVTLFGQTFQMPVHVMTFGLTIWYSIVVTVMCFLLAYPLAYYISFHVPASKKSMWLFLVTLPFWTSYIIRVSLWRVILGYNGVIDSSLMGLGVMDEPLNILSNGVLSIVITLAHAYAPFAILPIFVVLEKVDRSLLEAGQDLGESKLRTFFRVTLPLSMPGVIAAVLIVFIPTVGDYVTPELIGGGKVPMIANIIESQLLKQRDQALGSALSVTVMAIVAVVSIVFLFVNRKFLGGAQK